MTTEGWIKYSINEDLKLRALEREKSLTGFKANKTLDGPFVGAFGEVLAEDFFKSLKENSIIKDYQYTGAEVGPDFTVQASEQLVFTIDVKTKRRTKPPEKRFEMSVPCYLYDNESYNDPDLFMCIQINTKLDALKTVNDAWIIGFIPKHIYRFHRYIEYEGRKTGGASGKSGTMPCDVFQVEHKYLHKFSSLLKYKTYL